MTIKYSKKFRKQFKKLRTGQQRRFWERLEWFKANEFDPRLANHVLQGKFTGLRSISIAGDLRALYEIVDDEIYIYQMIGSHSQLYK